MTRKHLGFGKAAAIGLALAAVPALRGAPVTAAAPAASPASPAAAVPVGGTGELSVARGHTLPGGKAGEPDVCLGVIPTRPISGKVWLNPFTNAVEQRITPAVLHPIPTLRAAHVLLYPTRPDLTKVGADQLAAAGGEAELADRARFTLVGTGRGDAFLLALTDVALSQDKPADWRVRFAAERVALAAHVADPVADRGRSVAATDPLPLAGRLVVGRRSEDGQTTTLVALNLPAAAGAGKPATELAKGKDLRVAVNGTIGDLVDENTIELTDKAGRRAGTVKVPSRIDDWNLSPDGRRVVVGTDRQARKNPDDIWAPFETVSAVYEVADGRLVGEVVGYDDAAFLPDGRLVVTGKYFTAGLAVADPATGKVTPIKITGDALPDEVAVQPLRPTVSPDGKRIAYTDGRAAYVVGVDGRGWTPVWANPEQEPQCHPVFSPDGRYLALVNVPLTVMTGPGQVLVFDLEKQTRQSVGGPAAAHSAVPLAWLP